MPEIIFVPTSHVARESLENVRNIVSKEKPDCIALELDVNRYHALKAEESERAGTIGMIKAFGLFTFLIFWVMKKLQNYFGGKTGILPGSEMLRGVEIAEEMGIPYAFIDQPIEETFMGIKEVPFSEKLGLIWMLIKAVFGVFCPFGKKVEIDLNRLPTKKLIEHAMRQFRKELPNFYKVLVEDRNRHMASNLKILGKEFQKIVCVVGAGHEDGMRALLGQ